jgi:hypothetical protein
MGLESALTLHVDKVDMLGMFMFIPAAEAEEPISRETET